MWKSFTKKTITTTPLFGRRKTKTESRPMTKAEEAAFDEAMKEMDAAFKAMDKAFKAFK